MRAVVVALAIAGCVGWGIRNPRPVAAAALPQRAAVPSLRVAIIGRPGDDRIAPAREAIDYWNREFTRLGRSVKLDEPIMRADTVSDALLREVSGEAGLGMGTASLRLLASLSGIPADIVIALSSDSLISFAVRWREGSKGVVGVRRSDIPPLSLPNTVRNVIAHEIGHVLGLLHNSDSTTLMCGRPASCRPAAFASDAPRFFPLTSADDALIRARWP